MGFFFKNSRQDNIRETSTRSGMASDIVQNRRIDISRESLEIIDKTTNPEVFFERCLMAGNEACLLMNSNHSIIYKGMKAREIYEMLRDDFSKEESSNTVYR